MKLSEAVNIKPDEREHLNLPSFSYIDSILPKAQSSAHTDDLPISVNEEKWSVKDTGDSKRLSRVFDFQDSRMKAAFFLEIIDYEDNIHHNAKITMFESRVKVEVWTRDIDDITEIDLDYAEEVDSIFEDVVYHFERTND